jgi:hypothetical protein
VAWSVIINDTGMSSGIEYFVSSCLLIGEEVDSLVNVFVESYNPVEV